jgi:hypothetical protein
MLYLCYQTWLGIVNLFQTFDGDPRIDIGEIRELIDSEETA